MLRDETESCDSSIAKTNSGAVPEGTEGLNFSFDLLLILQVLLQAR